MDFLSRLIGGAGAGPGRRSNANNPQQRLSRFKKTYSQVLQAWNKATPSKLDPASTDSIRYHLQRLTTLLHDDTRAPAPHLCLSFAASSQIYITIARIALSLSNEDIVRETVAIFSALVDNDEENLLGTGRFAKGLMTFVDRVLGSSGLNIGPQTQGEILELIFGIAAKIRLEPDLLPVWFRPKNFHEQAAEPGQEEKETSATDHKDFPLCYQFIGHVYNEGRAGDFARTGLLYIFESASTSRNLEDWIIESDLPTLMASGLGALYSQLSRKLTISHPSSELPLILALSDDDKPPSTEVENFYSEDLQIQLTTFMSNLVFWQDILEHCRSIEIKQTLIDHFHIFFLQQILYPSMLESSDLDGGSSVAVLTYLWQILDSVDHPDLIQLILHYLLAIPGSLEVSRPFKAMHEKRRKSLMALSQTNAANDGLTPSLFNLVDLIQSSITSTNAETVTAALRLITIVIHKHHGFATSTLIKTVPFRPQLHGRTTGAVHRELDTYLGLAQDIGGQVQMDESYQGCLKDALASIESHVCSLDYLGIQAPGNTDAVRRGAILEERRVNISFHCLMVEDPLIQGMTNLLSTFLTNSIETNLELTNALSHLASCPLMRLEGWLADDPILTTSSIDISNPSSPVVAAGTDFEVEEEQAEIQRVQAYKAALKPSHSSRSAVPPMVQVFRHLCNHVKTVRTVVPELDHYVASRKRAFQGATEIENETRSPAPLLPSPRLSLDMSRDSSRTRAGSVADSPLNPAAMQRVGSNRGRPPQLSTPTRSPRPMSPAQRAMSPILSPTPVRAARPLSPLKHSMTPGSLSPRPPPARASSSARSAVEEEVFEKKIKLAARAASPAGKGGDGNDQDGDGEDGSGQQVKEATFNHILTNIIILQEFILELAAIMQVRASLLDGEIRFA